MKIRVISEFYDKFHTSTLFKVGTVLDFDDERAKYVISKKLAEPYKEQNSEEKKEPKKPAEPEKPANEQKPAEPIEPAKPADEKPADEKPVDEKPADEQKADEQKADEQNADAAAKAADNGAAEGTLFDDGTRNKKAEK